MKKILIVEDNKDINKLLCLLLEQEYEVESCYDGRSGVDAVKAFEPDLVILDIMLLKMDGRVVLTHIQNMAHQLKVIVYSSSGWKGANSPDVYYCPKGTYSPKELIEVVHHLLEE